MLVYAKQRLWIGSRAGAGGFRSGFPLEGFFFFPGGVCLLPSCCRLVTVRLGRRIICFYEGTFFVLAGLVWRADAGSGQAAGTVSRITPFLPGNLFSLGVWGAALSTNTSSRYKISKTQAGGRSLGGQWKRTRDCRQERGRSALAFSSFGIVLCVGDTLPRGSASRFLVP